MGAEYRNLCRQKVVKLCWEEQSQGMCSGRLDACEPLSGRHPQSWLLCLANWFRFHPCLIFLGPWLPLLMAEPQTDGVRSGNLWADLLWSSDLRALASSIVEDIYTGAARA